VKVRFAWESEDLIWSVIPDEYEGNLILEIRNPLKKTVNFLAIHKTSGKLIFDGFSETPDWWSRPRYAFRNTLLIERYQNPDLPETLGLMAFDFPSESLIWENPYLRFYQANGNQFMAETQNMGLKLFRLADGTLDDATSFSNELHSTFKYPFTLNSEYPLHTEILEFINAKTGLTQITNIQYGEPGGHILLDCETSNSETISRHLLIINKNGNLILEKKWTVAHNYSLFIQFFWSENTLFVIENQHLLTAYELD